MKRNRFIRDDEDGETTATTAPVPAAPPVVRPLTMLERMQQVGAAVGSGIQDNDDVLTQDGDEPTTATTTTATTAAPVPASATSATGSGQAAAVGTTTATAATTRTTRLSSTSQNKRPAASKGGASASEMRMHIRKTITETPSGGRQPANAIAAQLANQQADALNLAAQIANEQAALHNVGLSMTAPVTVHNPTHAAAVNHHPPAPAQGFWDAPVNAHVVAAANNPIPHVAAANNPIPHVAAANNPIPEKPPTQIFWDTAIDWTGEDTQMDPPLSDKSRGTLLATCIKRGDTNLPWWLTGIKRPAATGWFS